MTTTECPVQYDRIRYGYHPLSCLKCRALGTVCTYHAVPVTR